MKITAIKRQVKQPDRYSVFVDGEYTFSLSDQALLESKLVNGQELSAQQVREFKKLSDEDKLYNSALRYVAIRPRSEWELRTYLEKKSSSEEPVNSILNKLSKLDLLDDAKFARSFVSDRRLLRPTSRRKLVLELRKKRVPEEIISEAIGDEHEPERDALTEMIKKKRRQTKYQDKLKLMQYLARQGFNYGDIKNAFERLEND
jgi:regulatory protein